MWLENNEIDTRGKREQSLKKSDSLLLVMKTHSASNVHVVDSILFRTDF